MRNALLIALCLSLMLPMFNCATILDGSKKEHERTSDIQWGFVVLDILFTPGLGLIGLIVDFSTGAIYKREPGTKKSEIENNLKEYASQGKPCYRLRDEGLYKIELINGQLKESKVEKSVIPAKVWQTIEKEKSLRMAMAPQYGK